MKTVLQKYIAEAGHFSRRQAEELIRAGKARVNGQTAELGMRVDKSEEIEINGRKLGLAKAKIYLKLNKPAGYTCTSRRFKGEKNIFELINTRQRLFAAGRLDKDSRGLVLLTNDGDLSQRLAHPKYEHEKEYEAKFKIQKANPKIIKDIAKILKKGIDIGEGDGVARAKAAKYLGGGIVRIILTQGKKRQIRRMLKKIGLEVEDLTRVRIGNLKLGDLKEGESELIDSGKIKDIFK